jgi:hypothetical protein
MHHVTVHDSVHGQPIKRSLLAAGLPCLSHPRLQSLLAKRLPHHLLPPDSIFPCHPDVYVKVKMPPVTRTQTRSLPKRSENASSTTEAPLTPPANAVFRRPHRRIKSAERHSQAKDKTTDLPSDSQRGHPHSPPRFTINLSLPPSERYAEVCHALRDEMRSLQSLFDEVVGGFLPWWLYMPSVVLNWAAWALLWRVCDAEEDAELDVSFPFLPYHSVPCGLARNVCERRLG